MSAPERCFEGFDAAAESAASGCRFESIRPGLELIFVAVEPGEVVPVDISATECSLVVGLLLSGEAGFDAPEAMNENVRTMTAGSVAVRYAPEVRMHVENAGTVPIRMLGIVAGTSVLQSVAGQDGGLDRFFAACAPPFNARTRMTALQRVAAGQIVTCSFVGLSRSLFLQGKIFELLAYQLEELCGLETVADIMLTPDDAERIRRARTILSRNMVSPPGLEELAGEVGVNINKLKKGFKAVFHKTAFGCLHEDRMHQAQSLLLERRLNVSQVAWEVGYTNVGYFSRAFRKFYGVRPKDVRCDSGNHFTRF